MTETVLKIDGMSCPMCESHVNDVVRSKFNVKKVTSSHKKGETVIVSESSLNASELSEAIGATGYKVLSVDSHPYVKKGLFSK
ncbi:MAG: ATPase P [Oscillospiraceae bacterium]|nr:ATPase P [Ruminococcus sp.]MCD8345729.1 ATPase P [Oscillospiraceae bacterium]